MKKFTLIDRLLSGVLLICVLVAATPQYLPLTGGTLSGLLHLPNLVFTSGGSGLADWFDQTAGCHANRGQVNVRDCGAVADGAFVQGACGNTSPNGCFFGTDNTTAIRSAATACNGPVATGSGGCTVYFPNSGTNVWMVGAPSPFAGSDDCVLNSQTGYYGIFNLANGTRFQGQGRWTTTIMANPGTAQSRTCAMIQNNANIPLGIQIVSMRLDGNEGTNSIHNDWLHPNNNFGTSVNRLMGLNINGTQQNGPALIMNDFAISGFVGSGVDGPLQGASSLLGGSQLDEFTNGYILYNQYGTFVMQNADSSYNDIYWYVNGAWNGADGLDIYNGGANFTANYFGGGSYGTAQVLLIGSQGSRFAHCTFDNTGSAQLRLIDNGGTASSYNTISDSVFSQAGNGGNNSTSVTSATVSLGSKTFATQTNAGYYTGQPILFVDSGATSNWMTGSVTSYSGTALVVNITALNGSGTFTTWNVSGSAPLISVEGHSASNKFNNLFINTGPLGHTTFGIQEIGSATGNSYDSVTFDSSGVAFGLGAYQLASGSTSKVADAVGNGGVSVTDTPPNATSFNNGQTVLLTALGALGSSPTIGCDSGSSCTPNYGVVAITVGSSTTTGDVFSAAWTVPFLHKPVCLYTVYDATANANISANYVVDSGSTSTTQSVLSVNGTAPIAGHIIKVVYQCW